jgi:hypothetical protein
MSLDFVDSLSGLNLGFSITSHVALAKLPDLSVPEFLYLKKMVFLLTE